MTETDVQQLILNEVGGQIPDTEIILDVTQVAAYWAEFAQFSGQFELRRCYVKLRCINHLIGQLRTFTNASIGNINPQLGMRLQTLQQMMSEVMNEIQMWQQFYVANRTSKIAKNPVKAPYERPNNQYPDPNLRRQRGDAQFPPIIID